MNSNINEKFKQFMTGINTFLNILDQKNLEALDDTTKQSIMNLYENKIRNDYFGSDYDTYYFKNDESNTEFVFAKEGNFRFFNDSDRALGIFTMSETTISAKFFFIDENNLDKEGPQTQPKEIIFERSPGFIVYKNKKFFNYDDLGNKLGYLWVLYGVRDVFENKLIGQQKRKAAVNNLVLKKPSSDSLFFSSNRRFLTTQNSMMFYFLQNGVFQIKNIQGEMGLGTYRLLTNCINAEFVYYDNFDALKEEEPIVHSITLIRTPEYVAFDNIKFYDYDFLIKGRSDGAYKEEYKSYDYKAEYNNEWFKFLLEYTKEAKFNNLSKISGISYTEIGYYLVVLRECGTFKGNLPCPELDYDSDVFGLYSVNEYQLNLEYYREGSMDQKYYLTMTYNISKGEDSLTMNHGENCVTLRAFENLYKPLWNLNIYNYAPRLSDNDIVTDLLRRSVWTNFTRIYRSDQIFQVGDELTRLSHRFDFFPNGTFLTESFNSENHNFRRTFGVYKVHDNELRTEFVEIPHNGLEKTILSQILTFTDSELKLDNCILKLTDGKKHPSPKVLLFLEKAAKNVYDIERNFL
jgi:hypothetical protein